MKAGVNMATHGHSRAEHRNGVTMAAHGLKCTD